MRIPGIMLLVAMSANTSWGQTPSFKGGVPGGPCFFNRLAITSVVVGTPSLEDVQHFFDISVLTEHRVFFPVGTMVTVYRQSGGWSCVTGPADHATSGAPPANGIQTGWMRTELLERMEPRKRQSCSTNPKSSMRCGTASTPK